MMLNLSFVNNQIRTNSVLRMSGEQYKRIEGFPALYIDRYSYIIQATVHARYGEPAITSADEHTPEGAYALHMGAFNSISWNTQFIMDEDHNYKSVSMADCELFKTEPFRIRRKGSVIIQNDVWIGQGCTIYGGVTIHNGAVVAGNSVVTKDVPPYWIVGGAPARPIKPRFDEGIIKKLLAIQWWDWSNEKIRANRSWFEKEPESFANRFYREISRQPERIDIPSWPHTYLFFPDFDEPFGVWKHVVLNFCKTFARDETRGLVLFVENNSETENYLRELEVLTEHIDAVCQLYVYAGGGKRRKQHFPVLTIILPAVVCTQSNEPVWLTNLRFPLFPGLIFPFFERGKTVLLQAIALKQLT